MRPLVLPGNRYLPANLLHVFATPSGGPGGQHANRTATKVVVRVAIDDLPLSADERNHLRQRLGRRVHADGTVQASAHDHRSQYRNRMLAIERLERLLADALQVPRTRRPTRRTRSSDERRLAAKQQSSQRKQQRAWRPGDDD